MSARSILFALAISTTAADVRADTLDQYGTVLGLQTGAAVAIPVPRFDPSLGVLQLVRVHLHLSPYGTVGLENTNATPADFSLGWYTPYWHSLNASFRVAGLLPSGNSGVGYAPPPMLLAAYDGVTDFDGASGRRFTAVGSGIDGHDGMIPFLPSGTFDTHFTGTGYVVVQVGPLLLNSYWEGGTTPPGIAVTGWGWNADAQVRIQYDYVPHPATLCMPLQVSGATCPCGNTGAAGAGCANSVQSSGGLLSRTGIASIANDTASLVGSRMTNSNALYFQGTAYQNASSAYGDGLRCVTGTLVRLGTRTNVGGSSSVPAPGGPPLSVAGGVASPGTRYYQAVYRDNGAFCTPSNFNATNGVSIVWTN